MKKIAAIIGEPATGKSTLVKKFMEGKDWERQEVIKLMPTHFCKSKRIHVIGKYDEGEKFPGTDKLSMAVQPAAVEFVNKVQANMLFEGDRLSTASFLEGLTELDDAEVRIFYLKASDDILEFRHGDRGDEQSEQFLRGRKTKYANIMSSFVLSDYIEEFKNETPDDQAVLLSELEEFFGTN